MAQESAVLVHRPHAAAPSFTAALLLLCPTAYCFTTALPHGTRKRSACQPFPRRRALLYFVSN